MNNLFLMIPIQTATSSYKFDDQFHSMTLEMLVYLTHREVSKQLHWKYLPLKKGSFGYDTFAESIGRLLSTPNVKSIEQGASIVHDAWSFNYKWWRDCKPWSLLEDLYSKPTKPLGDKRRNKLAELSYERLPENEKETNRIFAKYLLVDLLGIIKTKDSDDTFID